MSLVSLDRNPNQIYLLEDDVCENPKVDSETPENLVEVKDSIRIPLEKGRITYEDVTNNPRRTEISEIFKKNDVWKNIGRTIDWDWSKAENEFLDSIKKNLNKKLSKDYLGTFIKRKIINNEISLDTLDLKNEALNYLNSTGAIPIFFNFDTDAQDLMFFEWLGKDRAQNIKKLSLRNTANISLVDLYFISPNLEELHLDKSFFKNDDNPQKMIEDIEFISLFPSLKTLNLSNFFSDDLNLFLDKFSTFKVLENLGLDFGCCGYEENVGTETSFIEKITHLKNLKKLNIIDYQPTDTTTVINDMGKLTQITHLSLSYSDESRSSDISRKIKEIGPYFLLPKNVDHFSINDYEMPMKSLTLAIIHKSLNNLVHAFVDHTGPKPLLEKSVIGSGSLLVCAGMYGLYSLVQLKNGQISTPLPTSKQLEVSAYAIRAFLALAAGFTAYYYKFGSGQIQKLKANIIPKKLSGWFESTSKHAKPQIAKKL